MPLTKALITNLIIISLLSACGSESEKRSLNIPDEFQLLKPADVIGYKNSSDTSVYTPNYFDPNYYQQSSTANNNIEAGTWVALHQFADYEAGQTTPTRIQSLRYFYIRSETETFSCGHLGFYDRQKNEYGEFSQQSYISEDGNYGYTENIQHIKISDNTDHIGIVTRKEIINSMPYNQKTNIYCLEHLPGALISISLHLPLTTSIDNSLLHGINISSYHPQQIHKGVNITHQESYSSGSHLYNPVKIDIRTTDDNIYFKTSVTTDTGEIETEFQSDFRF